MPKLTRAEVERLKAGLPGWTLDGEAIQKAFTFGSFAAAIRFVNRVAPMADLVDHHPDILVRCKQVTLTYSTHSEGGLTAKDFDAAATADRLA